MSLFGGYFKQIAVVMLFAFIVGWVSNSVISEISNDITAPTGYVITPADNVEQPSEQSDFEALKAFFQKDSAELGSPYDWIKEDQIRVYDDQIIIHLENAVWARFTDTNSMDPVIDAGANGIELIPESKEDIHVGDIISYESQFATGTIIHRVVKISEDENGWYCLTKGDNNPSADPGKIRFSQIKRILVGIIY